MQCSELSDCTVRPYLGQQAVRGGEGVQFISSAHPANTCREGAEGRCPLSRHIPLSESLKDRQFPDINRAETGKKLMTDEDEAHFSCPLFSPFKPDSFKLLAIVQL